MSILGNLFNRILHRGDPGRRPRRPQRRRLPVRRSPKHRLARTRRRLRSWHARGRSGADRGHRGGARRHGRQESAEAQLAHLHRRPDEAARHGQQLHERKELAEELGYTGDKSDSATMNIWLHKQVMQKLRRTAARCRRTCSTDCTISTTKETSMTAKNPTNADPITGAPGSHPGGTAAAGAVAGAAAGAALGSIAGPIGTWSAAPQARSPVAWRARALPRA